MQIPQQLAFEELKGELVRIIRTGMNNFNIPSWQVEIILKDLYNETHAQAMQEYQQSVKEYQEAQKRETTQEQE